MKAKLRNVVTIDTESAIYRTNRNSDAEYLVVHPFMHIQIQVSHTRDLRSNSELAR